YHSLIVAEPLPECLEATAWTEDGLIMAMAHKTRPVWSVQFHPESICSTFGRDIMRNFHRLAGDFHRKSQKPESTQIKSHDVQTESIKSTGHTGNHRNLRMHVRRAELRFSAEQIFERA